MDTTRRRGAAPVKALLWIYAAALLGSWFAMGWTPADHAVAAGMGAVEVLEVGGDGEARSPSRPVRLAYEIHGPVDAAETLLLLHGSPGSAGDFRRLVDGLGHRHRVIAVDLPGFGSSSRHVHDYSVRAHAGYCRALMDALGVERVHAVGFSMGGGVALEIAAAAPERVASLTLLASIGVIELELLGDHALNNGLHRLQAAAFRAARWLVPHYGALDRSFLSYEYARNFQDSDQRRLRPALESYDGPMLILHGEDDFLVPVAAAREHARIVPQARLRIFPSPDGHFLPWTDGTIAPVTEEILSLVDRAASGAAPMRIDADPVRLAAAEAPFDPLEVPPFEGPALLAICALLAVATFVSEDLACIAAGLLVADGRLGMLPATVACFVGIYVGDMLLYLVGRVFGRPALARRPLAWFVKEAAVERASRWFERRGIAVIFLSRFTPGLRLPTYVAAGVLRTRFAAFALFFAIAGVVWTPALVGIAAVVGDRLAAAVGTLGAAQLPWLIALVIALLETYSTLPLLFTHRGHRVLRGRWMRRTRWEFWPPWITYLPLLPFIAWLGVKYRGLSKVTAVNPAMPAGGFVGESKTEILGGLGVHNEEIPAFISLRLSDGPDRRERAAADFIASRPGQRVVLKPDAGQRGSGVALLEDPVALRARARDLGHDAILQECVGGEEFGVFYVREPGSVEGRIFGVTTKVLPTVTGDGRRTCEELLLDDERACAMHATYLEELGGGADDVPGPGEIVQLVEVGTHARGAIFLDGAHLITPELEAAVERIASRYEGFHFGRFDLRAPSADHLARGDDLKVIELNGVTSEATRIYDPKHSIAGAYRILFEQWEIAYKIGTANAAAGASTTSLPGILRAWMAYRLTQRSHDARGTAAAKGHPVSPPDPEDPRT